MSTPCPGCGAALSGDPTCASCELPLTGPVAGRLWEVDQELAAVSQREASLRGERERLLEALRTGAAIPVGDGFAVMTPVPGGRPVASAGLPLPPPPPREANPHQVQNTLLGLGALLLAVAGVVFAAVTYRALGPAGRAMILIALTAVAALVPQRLLKRGLGASAEAVAAVALVLAVLDAWALRRAGVGGDVNGLTYSAVASTLLALAAGAYATAVPVRVARIGTVVLAQLPVLFLLARTEPPQPVVAATLAALAAVDLLAASEQRLPGVVRRTAVVAASVELVAALMASVIAIQQDDEGAGLGLLAVALVLAVASAKVTDTVLRALLSGSAVPLLAAAGWVTARPSLSHDQRPLVLVAVALLALTIAGLLPMRHRPGPVGGSAAVLVAALGSQAEAVLVAVAGPFTWLADPWSLHAVTARGAVSRDEPWPGTVIAVVVLAVAAICIVLAGLLLDRLQQVVPAVGVLLALALVVLPLGFATSYPLALALLNGFVTLLCAGTWLTRGSYRLALSVVAGSLAAVAAAWSVADREATLVVLPLLLLVAAAAAVRLPSATAPAALLGGAALAAYGADGGLERAEVGLLLLLAPAACVGLSFVLRDARRVGLEGAALVLATASVATAADDATLLSVCLGISGLLTLAVAIRPDRHDVGLLGGLLLTASSWVRLWDADVDAPEPYVAPLAVTALVFGHLRWRGGGASSFQAYGAGLSVALVPSLLKSFDDTSPARGLALVVVCVLVVLVGASMRLRAPLAIGGGVLALDVLHLLAPVADALPRWSLLAVAGLVLVGVGVSYEQRLRDLAALRERYERLT